MEDLENRSNEADRSASLGDPPEETEESPESLISRTLPLDISVSSYYDLLTWCRRLELDESGNSDALKRRLYSYYEVSAPVEKQKSKDASLLELEDSNLLEFTTVDDRTNITFTGEVLLTFTEESGAVHKISADLLDFNQEEQIITAYGNVIYSLEKKGEESPEVFRGNSLTFDIDSWAGLFFQGMSERDTTIKDTDANDLIKFYYYGDVIYRSSGDTVILSNGSITTCDREDPHLEIKARKIWVLAPGEWAILNGIFYVGRVPMFYIPGFLKNGDPLFFNPTVGFVSDSGYTFQTTTYLLGEKEKKEEDSIIDFMQVTGDEDFEREIEGLFLRESNGLSSIQRDSREYAKDTGSTLKMMADYYSYMGGFLGLSGTLNKLGPVTKVEIYLGLAKSRQVYSSGSIYTPFQKNDDGEYVSNWEDGFFLNYDIPFRFAFDVNMSMSLGKFSLGLDLPIYSDPYFLVDFNERKEDIELDEFANFDTTEDSTRRSSTSSLISSEKWELKTSFKPSTGSLAPYLNSASLNRLNFSMTWSKKSMPTDLIDTSIDSFFYPSGLTYLDYSINLSGKLLQDGKDKVVVEGDSESSLEGLLSPWADKVEEDPGDQTLDEHNKGELNEEELNEEENILIQDIFSNFSTSQVSSISWYTDSLSWSIVPDGSFYGKFDSDDWEQASDIDYITEYQVFRGNLRGNINYNATFMDNLLSFKNSLDATGKYNDYFYRSDGLEDSEWQNYQDQADALNNLTINNNLGLTVTPFQYYDRLKSTTMSYQFKTNLYLWDWDSENNEYESLFFEWDEEYIITHSLIFNLKGELFDDKQSLSFNIDLPPDNMKYATALNLVTGPLTSAFSMEISQKTDSDDEKIWEKQPLTLNETFNLNEYFSMSQKISYIWEDEYWGSSITSANLKLLDGDIKLNGKFTYDLDETQAESATLNLSLWQLTASFGLKRQYPYTFSLDDGWQIKSGSTEDFLPDSLSLQYQYDLKEWMFWKNRIKIGAKVNTSWNMDLIQFTDSNFKFDLTFSCTIHDFMTLSLTSSSKNNATFRYFPSMAEIAGVDALNPFEDLFKSFNFFVEQDRIDSNFNLNSMKLSMTHDLHDWDLVLELTGSPEVKESGDYNVYEWVSKFSIYVNWKAWTDLEAKVDINDNEIVF
ncbi:MAG: LPS-assembly protein LptD [Spirochaetales bacterium]|nr:LPS-assembly protein LptD [Spirochaetales bacterium]